MSYRRLYTSHTVSEGSRTHIRAYARTPLRRQLSVYHWELAICFNNGSGGKAVAKQYGERKAQYTHAYAEAFNPGYHTRPNGAASLCHKLVVAVPQLRHHTAYRYRADGQEENSKTTPKEIVSDAEVAAQRSPAETGVDRPSIGGVRRMERVMLGCQQESSDVISRCINASKQRRCCIRTVELKIVHIVFIACLTGDTSLA